MFVQIRGTFGSGKTTVARSLYEYFNQTARSISYVEKYCDGKLIKRFATELSTPCTKTIYFLGSYDAVKTSGADKLTQKGVHELIEAFIEEKSKASLVIAEGSILSGIGRYIRLGERIKEYGVLYVDMATSEQECLARILKRRKVAGNEKPFNPEGMSKVFKVVERMHNKTIAAGLPCWLLSSNEEDIRRVKEECEKWLAKS